jgi:3-hydroxyacyl-CoA dehydrogenase
MQRARVGLLAMAQSDRITDGEIDSALMRITTTTDLAESVRKADLVIEAVSEDLDLKRSIFRQIDTSAPQQAILASNTSTFLPGAIASATSRPEQVAGTHYYNPPHLLPGVEIIMGPETSEENTNLLFNLYRSIGKKPAIVRKEIQGFIGNRLQVALVREAMSLVGKGIVTAAQIDEVVRSSFGRQLSAAGLFELTDATGLDAALALGEQLLPKMANERKLPQVLLEKIEAGYLGVKTGRGFYDWTPASADAWRKNMADSLLQMARRER